MLEFLKGRNKSKRPLMIELTEQIETRLLYIPGVEGVAIGEEKGFPVVRVFVTKKTKNMEKAIQAELAGYPIRLEETGSFHAL